MRKSSLTYENLKRNKHFLIYICSTYVTCICTVFYNGCTSVTYMQIFLLLHVTIHVLAVSFVVPFWLLRILF